MKSNSVISLFFVFCFFCHVDFAFSQRKKPAPQTNAAVLDFDADRIGGERADPFNTFLQGSSATSFDSFLFLRKDFIEFQRSEFRNYGRRLRYRERIMYDVGSRQKSK